MDYTENEIDIVSSSENINPTISTDEDKIISSKSTVNFESLNDVKVEQIPEIEISYDKNELFYKSGLVNDTDASFECPSDTSSQNDFYHQNIEISPERTLINETELKYLEEQANLKRLLEDSETRCRHLQNTINQKDEVIDRLEKDKKLLDREKAMLKKENDISTREKETAVIRYVTLEKKIIDMKNSVDAFEKKYKEAQKEIESMNGKIKIISNEKTRICNILDAKCQEFKNSQKDCEKVKNDLASLEMKSKWNLVKLKQEMESKVLAEKKVEELNQEILKLNSQPKVDDKNYVNDEQLIEHQATLILLKHGNEEKERRIELLETKISTLQIELSEINNIANNLIKERDNLFMESTKYKLENEELQLTLDREVLKVAELQAKMNDFETLKTQLSIEKESAFRRQKELETLKNNYEERASELNKLRIKETELLQFNKELTERTVKLQNDISLYNAKSVALCLENETIKKDKKYYEDKINELELDITNEKKQRNEERILLTRHISEKTKLYDNVQKKLEHSLGDLDAIKKKHSQTVKEFNRELAQFRKKSEQNIELQLSLSRKSSTDTIDSNNENDLKIKTELVSQNDNDSQTESIQNEFQTIQIKEPSKKTLIDRIVRLQHASAKQSEKIDFLENHSANLATELQKKQKLIQYYMLRDQTGALSSTKSDRNKAELAKYGGIMAAIYSGFKSSNTTDMTLELSLEINRKLQAVLEDTLLKNITLKENLDTISQEIDKLKRHNSATHSAILSTSSVIGNSK